MDLIGFLDILSAVLVIILLVISVLALSAGVQSTARKSEPNQSQERPVPAHQPQRDRNPPLARLVTIGGSEVSGSTAFLLCKAMTLREFSPRTGAVTRVWSLEALPAAEVARSITSTNVYLAAAGSCFAGVDALVEALRSTGATVGYEPVPESARTPWE